MEQELDIGEEDWAIGDLQAPGGGIQSSPPLLDLDQPTAPPPTPPDYLPPPDFSSLAQGHATDAAAIIRDNRGRVPASSKAIEGLQEVTAPPTDDDCCAICLQEYFDSRPDPAETSPPSEVRLRAMPCSHTFHENCIFEWLRRNAACPLCRHQLPMEDEEDQGSWSSSRVVYNEGDGQYHVLWSIRDHAFPGGDEDEEVDPEQPRWMTAYLRDALASWHNMVAQSRQRQQSELPLRWD
ncbi:unnamed protein product [Urochloa humidicola]